MQPAWAKKRGNWPCDWSFCILVLIFLNAKLGMIWLPWKPIRALCRSPWKVWISKQVSSESPWSSPDLNVIEDLKQLGLCIFASGALLPDAFLRAYLYASLWNGEVPKSESIVGAIFAASGLPQFLLFRLICRKSTFANRQDRFVWALTREAALFLRL